MIDIPITKKDARAHFRNDAHMARELGITRGAVGQWLDDEPIPEKQALKLKYEVLPRLTKRGRKK